MNNRLLDWLSDDGVAIRMLKDAKRNQFYESAFRDLVPDKNCIDVGFGTGLLSFLALKHGARSIRAYESNVERYELGQHMIRQLGFEDQIELVNERFNASYIRPEDDVIFHEIIGAVLYSEGLSCTFNNHIPVCPSNYKTDFVLFEVDRHSMQSLKLYQPDRIDVNRMQKEFLSLKDQDFSTGLDLGNYNSIVSDLISDYFDYHTSTHIHKLLPKTVSDFTPEQFALFDSLSRREGTPAGTIEVDSTEQRKYVEIVINKELLKNKTLVIVPHCYFSFGPHTLNIQDCHWNARMRWQESAILDCVNEDLHIRQSLTNGHIIYWTE